jgi:hypothetical protein
VADALDLDRAADRVQGRVAPGTTRPVPAAVLELVDVPGTWQEHDELLVDGAPVAWWRVGDVLHARPEALADALASVAGRRHRERIAALLAGADPAGVLLDLAVEEPRA